MLFKGVLTLPDRRTDIFKEKSRLLHYKILQFSGRGCCQDEFAVKK